MVESIWSVSKLSTESVGSRRELVAKHRRVPTRLNSTVEWRRQCVLGIRLLSNCYMRNQSTIKHQPGIGLMSPKTLEWIINRPV